MTSRFPRACAIVLVAVAAAGCGIDTPGRSPGPASGVRSTNGLPAGTATRGPTPIEVPATSSAVPAELPSGFPVIPGAEAARLPDDPGVVARWRVDQVGSASYDWYVSALPAAGFEIVGTYPSERTALIRFEEKGGRTWQLLIELLGEQTQISVQTDRP